MKRSTAWIGAALLTLGLVATATVALAHERGGQHGGMMGGAMMSDRGEHMGSGGMMIDRGMQGERGGMMMGRGMHGDRGGMMQRGMAGWHHGMGPMMMQPPMMSRLELDDDQRRQMRELRREHMVKQAERRARMMDLREDMEALMRAERPDADAVEAVHAELAEVHGQMLSNRIRMRNRVHDLLDDEQREQIRELHWGGDGQGRERRGEGQGTRDGE